MGWEILVWKILVDRTQYARILSEPRTLGNFGASEEAVARVLIILDIDAVVPDLTPRITPRTLISQSIPPSKEIIGVVRWPDIEIKTTRARIWS